jgi:translation initiation factor 1 (eIF-1/SUI1)
LSNWRARASDAAPSTRRGPKGIDKRDSEIASLTRKLTRSEAEVSKLRKVVEIQGNVSALLAEMLGTDSAMKPTEL